MVRMRARTGFVVTVVLTAVLVGGYTSWPRDLTAPSEPVTAVAGSPLVRPASIPPERLIDAAPPMLLQDSFAEFSATVDATVGVAVTSKAGTVTYGPLQAGPAWSTIKVPIAIAASRKSPSVAARWTGSAISASDNGAAEQLWSLLGDATQAARAVEAVLREGGDSDTSVQTQRVRPEYSIFGQTNWTLAEQSRFASRLPCLGDADPVINWMRNLIPGHQWGLSQTAVVAAKGGWGPDWSGRYLVRQFAVVPVDGGGIIGVSLATQPEDGSFGSGVEAINSLAQWVRQHIAEFAAVRC